MFWYPFVMELLKMTLAGSVVIAGVLAARLLLRKAPRWISYTLWAVVLARLLVPFSLQAPHGLVPKQVQALPEDAYYQTYERVTPGAAADAAVRAVGDTLNGGIGTVYIKSAVAAPMPLPASHRQVWTLALAAAWPIGAAGMAVYALVSYLQLRRKLVGAVKLDGNVCLADGIPSPFVLGLVRPKIYLPSTLTAGEADYILRHERTHIRRLDHITRFLAFLALALHWFNPLVWLAFVLSGRDMEVSCDEAVLSGTETDIRGDYAQSLLNLSTQRRFLSATPLAFGEGNVKNRIRNVLGWKKAPAALVALCLCLALLLGVFLMTDSSMSSDERLLRYFNEEFFYNHTTGSTSQRHIFRNHFATHYYASPMQIDFYELFYDGGPEDSFLFDLEHTNQKEIDLVKEYFEFNEYTPVSPIYKTSTEELDAIFQEYTGFSQGNTFRRGLGKFQYIFDTNALYWSHGDTNMVPLTFYDLAREDDLIHLYYNQTDIGYSVLTLRKTVDSYQFVSNLLQYYDQTPQELQTHYGTEYSDFKTFSPVFATDHRPGWDYELIGFTAKRDGGIGIGYAAGWRGLDGRLNITSTEYFAYIHPITYEPITDTLSMPSNVYVTCGIGDSPDHTFSLFLCNEPDLARIRVFVNETDYFEQEITAPMLLALPTAEILPDVAVFCLDSHGMTIAQKRLTWSEYAHCQMQAMFDAGVEQLNKD